MREPGQIKRDTRIEVDQRGILVDSEGVESRVTVTDISKEGCRLITDGTPIIGEHVVLRVGKAGDVPAQVRWALGHEAGLHFTAGAPVLD
ncbi:PilZ domain-containing protein [Sphingomicrobium nitratireducens]|uniref:PilZ domain-containing protein n=1 Tax=Sphingomicrobium nitratireducens TaxID=2964666 RepID=UPI00223F8232|nr:PilZ domain-containing protein [Sphingomicrobium nitratireducens]